MVRAMVHRILSKLFKLPMSQSCTHTHALPLHSHKLEYLWAKQRWKLRDYLSNAPFESSNTTVLNVKALPSNRKNIAPWIKSLAPEFKILLSEVAHTNAAYPLQQYQQRPEIPSKLKNHIYSKSLKIAVCMNVEAPVHFTKWFIHRSSPIRRESRAFCWISSSMSRQAFTIYFGVDDCALLNKLPTSTRAITVNIWIFV